MQTRELEMKEKFRNIGFRKMFLIPVPVQKRIKQLLRCHRQPRKSITFLPKNVDLGAPEVVL